MDRLSDRLLRPVDGASLAVFRIAFGLMMCTSVVRFMASGWIETLYVKPTFFFKYPGFAWTVVWSKWGLYLHFGALALLALFVAAGLFYRVSIALFALGFAYVQLLDVTNYLNHYYLIVLISLLMIAMPLGRMWSIDAARRGEQRGDQPAWALYLLRFQVALVYVFAGLGKLESDWLFHAQPLNIWLSARTETPLIGPLLGQPWFAYAASWFGCIYDLSIVAWLSWRRTRAAAYVVVLAFHLMTHVWFDIGMFPVIMPLLTLLFFEPGWPRTLVAWLRRRERAAAPPPAAAPAPSRLARLGLAALALYVLVQIAVPLRQWLHPGTVLWHELGMRYSWRVMLREKNGSITYRVRRLRDGRVFEVTPHRYLTWRQANEMSSQPDLIVALAKHIGAEFRRRGHGAVQVRCDAWVSLNGRRAARLLDPRADLVRVGDLARVILPPPTSPPSALAQVRRKR